MPSFPVPAESGKSSKAKKSKAKAKKGGEEQDDIDPNAFLAAYLEKWVPVLT